MQSKYSVADVARFWSKVAKSTDPDGCWLWTGYRRSDGQCEINIGRRPLRVRRVAYGITKGAIPAGHRCVNTCTSDTCCRPEHLATKARIDKTARPECACGCGEQVDLSKGRFRKRFIHGHNMRGAKRGPSTPETRRRMAASHAGYWTDEEIALLIERYDSLFIDELVALLPRHSKDAIFVKAKLLRLSKAGDPSLTKAEKIRRALKGRIVKERNPNWQGLGRKLSNKLAGMRRRAWKLGTQTGPVNLDAIIERDRLICGICGKRVKRDKVSFDHIIPLSRGGAHSQDNLQVSHLACNVRRGVGKIPIQLPMRF